MKTIQAKDLNAEQKLDADIMQATFEAEQGMSGLVQIYAVVSECGIVMGVALDERCDSAA